MGESKKDFNVKLRTGYPLVTEELWKEFCTLESKALLFIYNENDNDSSSDSDDEGDKKKVNDSAKEENGDQILEKLTNLIKASKLVNTDVFANKDDDNSSDSTPNYMEQMQTILSFCKN